jgi:hypothetical protein
MQSKKKQKIQSNQVAHEGPVHQLKISSDLLVEEIRERAEEIFVERGSVSGDPIEDWLRAEMEIKSKYGFSK